MEKHKDWVAWAVETKALYIILIVCFALYLLTKSVLFAFLVAVSIISLFVAESVYSASKTGWKHELKEILIAVAVAGAIWYGGGFILGTSAPLDAIVSCSMLPHLERGDLVVLQGGVARAPEVSVSREEFDANNWTNQHLVCVPCGERLCVNRTMITPKGLVVLGEADQSKNLVQYECGICGRKMADGRIAEVACTKAISIKGQRIEPDYSNDVVVYTPAQGDVFAGETIHRVLARINVEGRYYYLMKGDNNEQLDIQYGNSPVPQEKVVGKVIFRMPYIGYFKLFLFGFLLTPHGCDSVLVQETL